MRARVEGADCRDTWSVYSFDYWRIDKIKIRWSYEHALLIYPTETVYVT